MKSCGIGDLHEALASPLQAGGREGRLDRVDSAPVVPVVPGGSRREPPSLPVVQQRGDGLRLSAPWLFDEAIAELLGLLSSLSEGDLLRRAAPGAQQRGAGSPSRWGEGDRGLLELQTEPVWLDFALSGTFNVCREVHLPEMCPPPN
jgi:hypothetical protein